MEQLTNTHWCLITGAPCAGKTTLINELQKQGFTTVRDAARDYVEIETSKGIAIDQTLQDFRKFQKAVFAIRVSNEKACDKNQLIFFDRGIPDSFAYYNLRGMNSEEVIQAGKTNRYKKVFILERFPIKQDAIRQEDDKRAQLIEQYIKKACYALDYVPIHIPIASIFERAKFILSELDSIR